MSRRRRLKVQVSAGMFSSERVASFTAGERHYTLIVDQEDVAVDGTIGVYLLAENGVDAIIDLPRETFTSGNRVRVPLGLLEAS